MNQTQTTTQPKLFIAVAVMSCNFDQLCKQSFWWHKVSYCYEAGQSAILDCLGIKSAWLRTKSGQSRRYSPEQ